MKQKTYFSIRCLTLFLLFSILILFTLPFSVTTSLANEGDTHLEQVSLPIYFKLGSFDFNLIDDEVMSLNTIVLQELQGIYYLFLPPWALESEIFVYFESEEPTALLNGDPIMSGDPTTAFSHGMPVNFHLDNDLITIIPMIGSRIPTIFIQTDSSSLDHIHASKSNREDVKFLFVDEDGILEHMGGGDMNGRGNATWDMPKKPYNFRLDSGTSIPLFGMREGRHWTLLANYIDDFRVRNNLSLDLAREFGISNTSHLVPTDVFINNVYMGIYDLVERRSISHAIHITDLEAKTSIINDVGLSSFPHIGEHSIIPGTFKYFDILNDPEDITGGYVLELELWGRYMDEPSGFVTNRGNAINLNAPEIASRAQVEYISSLFQNIEDAIYSEDGYNANGNHFSHYVDVDSFARMYILSEFLMELDAANTSFFMFKESDLLGDGKLYAGPPWDFDNTLGRFGTRSGVNLRDPLAWWVNRGHINFSSENHPHLLAALYQHEYFREIVVQLWREEFDPLVRVLLGYDNDHETYILRPMENYINRVYASRYMEKLIWPNTYDQVSSILHFARSRYEFLNSHWGH